MNTNGQRHADARRNAHPASERAWMLGGRAGVILSGLSVNILLSHLLSGPRMGAYLLLASLVTAAAVFAQMGLGQAVVPLVAAALALGQPGRAAAAVHTVFRCGLGAVAATALLLPLVLQHGPAGLSRHLPGGNLLALRLAGLWLAAQALQSLLAETFRGFRRLRHATLFGGLVTNMLLTALLAGLWVGHRHVGLTTVIGLAVATGLGVTAVGLIQLRTWLRAFPSETPPGLPALFSTSLPCWGTQVILLLIANTDLWVLAAFRPAREVALYGVAARAAALIALPLQLTNAAVAPVIPELYVTARTKELGGLLRRTATFGALASLLGLAVALCLGGPLLGHLFGRDYASGGVVLAVLAVSQFVNVAAGACGLTLMMTGHQKTMMTITLRCGLLALAAEFLVVGTYGAVGVAAAAGSILIVQNAWMLLAAKSRTGVWTCAGPLHAAPSQA